MLHSICQQIWKTQQWPQNWKRSVFIPIPKKGHAKECSKYCTIALISHACKEKEMATYSNTLAWKISWQRSLVGYSPWSCEESDTTEWIHLHFSLSCFREGKGNPLQCSCLENPRDGGVWWAAIYGVSQSWTRLKRLSSSSRTNQNRNNERYLGL